MKPGRASELVRLVIVMTALAAWWVASDHCALASALMRPVATAPAAQESCPGHSRPEKTPSQGELPCCKSLVATPAPAKFVAGYDSNAFVAQPFPVSNLLLVLWHFETPILELDTGPPEAYTFAESVLQRSLLAHAPPCLS
ncbi:MAG: hypothetical protein ACR2G0_02830 [Chthoniobacterales bacterium]